MKFELKNNCDFDYVWEALETHKGSLTPQPTSKVGHIRADHDGYRWWSNYFAYNDNLKTTDIKNEINEIGSYIIDDLFSGKDGRQKLFDFCFSHPDALLKGTTDEYDFFINGDFANYWLRAITRIGDYNLYIHVFAKS